MVCMLLVLFSIGHTTGKTFGINVYKKWGQKIFKKGKTKAKIEPPKIVKIDNILISVPKTKTTITKSPKTHKHHFSSIISLHINKRFLGHSENFTFLSEYWSTWTNCNNVEN